MAVKHSLTRIQTFFIQCIIISESFDKNMKSLTKVPLPFPRCCAKLNIKFRKGCPHTAMEFLSNKPLLITDTILRDAHQSQAATRMTLEQMLPACEILDSIG